MYISRAVLLALGVLIIFLPAIEEWALHDPGSWHRPYQLWLLFIVATYWNQRARHRDEF
jgi:hypothetical protein